METSKIIEPMFEEENTLDFSYIDIMQKFGFDVGRLIGSSKSNYLCKHPNDTVIFNANIVIKKVGKIWFGDININEDKTTLVKIANELNQDLYILREYDARFENESKPFSFYENKAVAVFKRTFS